MLILKFRIFKSTCIALQWLSIGISKVCLHQLLHSSNKSLWTFFFTTRFWGHWVITHNTKKCNQKIPNLADQKVVTLNKNIFSLGSLQEIGLRQQHHGVCLFLWNLFPRQIRVSGYLLIVASLLATCSKTLPDLIFLNTEMASAWDIPWRARPLTAKISSPATNKNEFQRLATSNAT